MLNLKLQPISFPAQPIYLKSRARCKKRRVWQPNGSSGISEAAAKRPGRLLTSARDTFFIDP